MMTRFLAFLLLAQTAFGAVTLTNDMRTWEGRAFNAPVKFTPLLGWTSNSTYVVNGPEFTKIPINGIVTVSNLQSGVFGVTQNNRGIVIAVPNSNAVLNFSQVATNGLTIYSYTLPISGGSGITNNQHLPGVPTGNGSGLTNLQASAVTGVLNGVAVSNAVSLYVSNSAVANNGGVSVTNGQITTTGKITVGSGGVTVSSGGASIAGTVNISGNTEIHGVLTTTNLVVGSWNVTNNAQGDFVMEGETEAQRYTFDFNDGPSYGFHAPVFYGSGAGLTDVPNADSVSGILRIGSLEDGENLRMDFGYGFDNTLLTYGWNSNAVTFGANEVFSRKFTGDGLGLTNLQASAVSGVLNGVAVSNAPYVTATNANINNGRVVMGEANAEIKIGSGATVRVTIHHSGAEGFFKNNVGPLNVIVANANQMNLSSSNVVASSNIVAGGRATATNGFIVRSNAWLAPPTLNEGDVWYTSSNGIPATVYKVGGVLTTNLYP